MGIRDIFERKRNVRFEEVSGVRQLCRASPFILPKFDRNVPTCTESLIAKPTPPPRRVRGGAVVPESSASTTVVQAPPIPSRTSLSAQVSPTSSLPPPKITSEPRSSEVLTTAVLTTATVISESSVASITSSIPGSSNRPIASIPLPSSITKPSAAATTNAAPPISSSSIQDSPFLESTASSSTSIPATAITSLIPTTSTSALKLIPTIRSTTQLPRIPAGNSIVSPSIHLSTNAKVAIITAIVLSCLATLVGAMYILSCRKRVARAQRDANFGLIDGGDDDRDRLVVIGGGGGRRINEEGGIGPNGYPRDVKMENGSLLDEVIEGQIRLQPEPAAIPIPKLKHTPIVTSQSNGTSRRERSNTTEMVTNYERKPSNKKKLNLISLPTPPTITVARAINDNGSGSSSQSPEEREERINALSIARTMSNGTHANANTPPYTSVPPINKVSESSGNVSSNFVSGSANAMLSSTKGILGGFIKGGRTYTTGISKKPTIPEVLYLSSLPMKSRKKSFPHSSESFLLATTTTPLELTIPTMAVAATRISDCKALENQLNEGSLELNALTQEYEAERVRRKRGGKRGGKSGKAGEVEMSILDSRGVGGNW